MEEVEASNDVGPAVGAILGGYKIVRKIGSGAMGAVYRAQDGAGKSVALKVLHRHLDDPASRERLRREAAALQGLRHPAVARVLDAELDGPEAFIVTGLVEGPTLEEEIDERGPLDPRDLFELADQLADALEAVHGSGVVHRDLTPSNVLISRTGPVLIDFGLAQGPGDARATRTGFVMGTPGYLAPELLDGAEPGPDTDWWSWAAVLAFSGTGRAPFGVSPTELVLRRSRQGQADLNGLPPRVARALGAALRSVSAERWGPNEVAWAFKAEADAFVAAATGVERSKTTVLETSDQDRTVDTPRDIGSTRVMPYGLASHRRPLSASAGGAHVPVNEEGAPTGRSVTGRAVGARPAPPVGLPPPVEGLNPIQVTGHRWLIATIGLALGMLAALQPGLSVMALLLLMIVSRLTQIVVDGARRRLARHGPRRSNAFVAAVVSPWHLLRAIGGILPAAAVGISAGVILVLIGLMLFAPGNLVIVPVGTLEAQSVGDMNAPIVDNFLLSIAMIVTIIVAWWGPVSFRTRTGARALLGKIAPSWWRKIVLACIALAFAVFAVWPLVDGSTDALWWPLPDRLNVVA